MIDKEIYPHIVILKTGNEITYKTKVRILRDNKYYLVPCIMQGYNDDYLLERFLIEIELIKHFYKLIGTEELNKLDTNQTSEEERLKQFFI